MTTNTAAQADSALSALQDSSLPTEVGDVELRAALTDVRELLGGVRQRARELARTLGRWNDPRWGPTPFPQFQ